MTNKITDLSTITSQTIELLYEFANALENVPGIAIKILDVVGGSTLLGDFVNRHARFMNVLNLSTRGLAVLEAAPNAEVCSHCKGDGCEDCLGSGLQIPYWVHICLTDRAYGGSEEGGWYFETSQLIESMGPFSTREIADNHLASLQPHVDKMNENRPDINSVLSEGQYVCFVERRAGTVGEVWPRQAPRYE